MNIYNRNGAIVASVEVGDSCEWRKELMVEEYVSLKFTLAEHVLCARRHPVKVVEDKADVRIRESSQVVRAGTTRNNGIAKVGVAFPHGSIR